MKARNRLPSYIRVKRRTDWVVVRDAYGKILFRYNPATRIVEVQRRREVTLVDLKTYDSRTNS